MLTARENLLETIKKGGKPDRLVKQYEPFGFAFGNPVTNFIRSVPYPGMEPTKDK